MVPSDLIEFTELAELRSIIMANWSAFEPALLDEDTTRVYLDRMIAIRHPDAHVRGLLPFEEQLASGMSGLVRNLVATYRSRMDPVSGLWPIVESITDSFGNTKTHGDLYSFPSLAVVRVGEKVTFRCRASDPDGLQLHWDCRGTRPWQLLGQQDGHEVEFEWSVNALNIGEGTAIEIRLWSDRQHHRHGAIDEEHRFVYTVIPPGP